MTLVPMTPVRFSTRPIHYTRWAANAYLYKFVTTAFGELDNPLRTYIPAADLLIREWPFETGDQNLGGFSR